MNLHPCPLCGESKGYHQDRAHIGLYCIACRRRVTINNAVSEKLRMSHDEAWNAAAAHAQGLREREQRTASYATALAVSLHAQHFSEVTQWKPLPDTLGLLTQIDNMVVGLRERIAELEAQRVPLTKAEITACCNESDTYKTGVWMRVHETTLERLVRAIERAHGIEEGKR